jgi:hypothetical protein
MFNKGLRHEARKHSLSLQIKTVDVMAGAIGEGKGLSNKVYRSKLDKFNDWGKLQGSIWEQMLHEHAFMSGLDKAKKLGYKGEDAFRFADLTAMRSQSMYSRGTKAPLLRSQALTGTHPFQTFSVEMWNHFLEVATKDKGGYSLAKRERVAKLFRLGLGVYLANEWSEMTTGKKKTTPGSFVPFLGGYVDWAISGSPEGGRIPMSHLELGRSIYKAGKDYINHGSAKKLRQIGVQMGTAYFGMSGGVQLNRIIDGTIAVMDEEVKDVSGRRMFKVEGEDKYIAPILGVWSTSGGKEYLQGKDKTKTRSTRNLKRNSSR